MHLFLGYGTTLRRYVRPGACHPGISRTIRCVEDGLAISLKCIRINYSSEMNMIAAGVILLVALASAQNPPKPKISDNFEVPCLTTYFTACLLSQGSYQH
jgi:hypothetical protein